MKQLNIDKLEKISGARLETNAPFSFRCHSGLACFNRCCRNLNLFLYPYDVIQIKNRLGISSDLFLEKYVDVVLRDTNFFPEVLLRMSEDEAKTCPFLTASGCSIYPDRPDACRWFPVEVGVIFDAQTKKTKSVYFFRPPDSCLGQYEQDTWTIKTYSKDQKTDIYSQMTIRWADLKRLFQSDPWGAEGPYGPKGKMAFMATYNVDRFRDFVCNSSFLKRYKINSEILRKIRNDDVALMKLGFEWVKFFLWGTQSKNIKVR